MPIGIDKIEPIVVHQFLHHLMFQICQATARVRRVWSHNTGDRADVGELLRAEQNRTVMGAEQVGPVFKTGPVKGRRRSARLGIDQSLKVVLPDQDVWP